MGSIAVSALSCWENRRICVTVAGCRTSYQQGCQPVCGFRRGWWTPRGRGSPCRLHTFGIAPAYPRVAVLGDKGPGPQGGICSMVQLRHGGAFLLRRAFVRTLPVTSSASRALDPAGPRRVPDTGTAMAGRGGQQVTVQTKPLYDPARRSAGVLGQRDQRI